MALESIKTVSAPAALSFPGRIDFLFNDRHALPGPGEYGANDTHPEWAKTTLKGPQAGWHRTYSPCVKSCHVSKGVDL